jgi:hypothetical protein
MYLHSRTSRVCLAVLLLSSALLAQPLGATSAAETQADNSSTQTPKFHSESRQVLVEAEVWKPVDMKNGSAASWIPEEALAVALEGTALRKVLERLPPAAKGLDSGDFHVFDKGVEQRINYFKEYDFPAVVTKRAFWEFDTTAGGIWGALAGGSGVPYVPSATYLIGYIPPALRPGECRTIQIVVPNHLVYVNRKEYCRATKADAIPSVQDAKLADRMERFAKSSKSGAISVSVRAFTFWSSGVLSLAGQTSSTGKTSPDASGHPTGDFTYIVEVHDSKAPATVQIATQFVLPFQFWDYPCRKNAAVNVLELVYGMNGKIEGRFGDTFRCDRRAVTPQGEVLQKTPGLKGIVPTLFDTQLELRPGEYEVRVVVSDGKYFGRAQARLQVKSLDVKRLTMSDIVLNSVLRDASWVVRDATRFTPDPVIPTPLVSKNVQFLPVPDVPLSQHNPLSVYFEIYKPTFDPLDNAIYYRMRITDGKTGATVMDTEPMSATDFVVPGSEVVPLGLKLDTDKLQKGCYKLEIQASDSIGHQSEWRSAKFTIQ